MQSNMVVSQVGPPLKYQAVTKQIVAAISFALNTNLPPNHGACVKTQLHHIDGQLAL